MAKFVSNVYIKREFMKNFTIFFFFFKYTQLPTVGNLRVYTFTY